MREKEKQIKPENSENVKPTGEETASRKFMIEDVDYKGRGVKLVSIESESQYSKNPEVVPPDWDDQVASAMDDTKLVFMAYFPPELKKTAYSGKILGPLAELSGELRIHEIYERVAQIAQETQKDVAVADIANKTSYLLYELPRAVEVGYEKAAYKLDPGQTERFIPSPVDARRMFTANGIMQEVERYPKNTKFMYVGAPAHTKRIKRYIENANNGTVSVLDTMRYTIYKNAMPGLDKTTRIYKPKKNGDGWIRYSNAKIK